MKRQTTNQLSGRRLILPALTVLALSFLAIPGSAEARTRVSVKVKTPIISAILNYGGYGPGLHVKLPARQHRLVLTKADRQIARKLARRTIYTKHELLQLRRVGYSWNQVGRLLRLPRQLMRSVLYPGGIKCGNDSRFGRGHRLDRDDRDRVVYKQRVVR